MTTTKMFTGRLKDGRNYEVITRGEKVLNNGNGGGAPWAVGKTYFSKRTMLEINGEYIQDISNVTDHKSLMKYIDIYGLVN